MLNVSENDASDWLVPTPTTFISLDASSIEFFWFFSDL